MLNKINISHDRQKLIVYLILIIVTLAVYWQVDQYDFVNVDDNVYVTENSHIQSGISLGVCKWAFSSFTYAEFWHPVTWLSLMLEYHFYGLNAGGYHLISLYLHILATLLLFWLFNRMTGAIWKSAFVAALFALHPLHVESVAWIAERKDVLSAFFWMLTLCLYVHYTEKPVIKRYMLVLFSFACALMSKPMVVTLPVIMIFLDYWPLGRFESQRYKTNLILLQLKEKVPFFILSAVFSIMTIYAHHNRSIEHFPLVSRLANALVSFVTYIGKTFWPHNMAVFNPFIFQIPAWQVIGASLLIILISVAVIVMAKRMPYLFVGWMWYTIAMAPVIGIIQIGDFAMADRYYYLPSIGITVMLTWGIPSLIKNQDIRKKILSPVAIAVLAILAFITWQQCGYWRNSTELLNHALRVTKNNYLAHNNLGVDLFEKGTLKEALYHFNEAIRLKADYVEAYNDRGAAYYNLGQYQLAIKDFSKAIGLKHDFFSAYNNRGIVYLNLGEKELGCHDLQKACDLGNCEVLKWAKSKGSCR
jgi:hypothetical protein